MVYIMAGFVEGICRSFGERLDAGAASRSVNAPETRHGLATAGLGVRFQRHEAGPASRVVDERPKG